MPMVVDPPPNVQPAAILQTYESSPQVQGAEGLVITARVQHIRENYLKSIQTKPFEPQDLRLELIPNDSLFMTGSYEFGGIGTLPPFAFED